MDNYQIDHLSVFWLGHSSIKIKTDRVVFYIDPFQIKNEEKADFILISHEHYDHLDPNSIDQLSKNNTEIIAARSCRQKLDNRDNVKFLSVGETFEIMGVMIKGFPAYNLNKPFHQKDDERLGYLIETDQNTLYFAGDTDHIPEMNQLEAIDLAFLPISGQYTMDEREAADAVFVIKPKAVIPIHYDRVAKGDPEKFRELIAGSHQVVILKPTI